MRRVRVGRNLVAVALLAVSIGAVTVSSADGSDLQRSQARTAEASPQKRTPSQQQSPSALPTLPLTASPQPPAMQNRACELLSGHLALLHGRGSIRPLRHVATRGLLRELRRNRPRVTPKQQQTRTRMVDLRAAFRSQGSARAVATLKDCAVPPYPLQLYLERRRALWVVTRIGDA